MIETDRLILIPLTPTQLQNLLFDRPLFEQTLAMSYQGESLEKDGLFDIFSGQLDILRKDERDWLYKTFWLFLCKEDRVVLGSCCFKGPPDTDGAVEVGYGIAEPFQNCGYTTEAISALCAWALQQPGVCTVTAETEKDNLASQRVVQKCDMTQFKETDTAYWWHTRKADA